MIAVVKIIHFLSFSVGIGGGVASALIGMRMRAAGADVLPTLQSLQKNLGRLSFAAIILLWITGTYMVFAIFGGFENLPSSFWIKILFVAILTAAALGLQVTAFRAAKSGAMPTPSVMATLGMTVNLAALLALIFAVYTFG